jgi:hypothetical protein
MIKGELIFMKYLKIEQNKGHFMSTKGTYVEIDKIDKNELMHLLNKAIENDEFEMDEYQENDLGNPAHKIIYKNIFDKFNSLLSNKTRFRDESSQLYTRAFEQYCNTEESV